MIGEIEQAIIDRLTAATSGATPPLGYKVPTIKSYGGELEDEPTKVVRNFPAWLIVFTGFRNPIDIGGGDWQLTAGFALIIGNQDRRNNTVARRGAGDKVGSYQMVIDALKLVVGSDLDLDISHIRPGRVVSVMQAEKVSIYSAEIETDIVLAYQAAAEDLDTFELLNLAWDVPVFGNVSEDLPADDADAEDNIEPEQDT